MKSEVRSWMTEKRGRRVFLTAATLAILSVVGAGTAQAGPPPSLAFSILDPVGDQQGTIDVTRMDMSWKTNNGRYTIILTADAAHPFTGKFRVNINLYDPDVLKRQPTSTHSFFQAVCNQCDIFDPKVNKSDIDLGSATTTTLALPTENSMVLKDWQAGDQVATHSLGAGGGPLGNPPGASLFRSSVNTDPIPGTFLTHEDVIGVNDLSWNGSYMTDTSGTAPIH